MGRTIPDDFFQRVEKYGRTPVMRFKDDRGWVQISWNLLGERVRLVAYGLLSLGLKPHECVAILSTNRHEWATVDLGILAAGGVSVPIYQTLPAKDVGYIAGHCEARLAFAQNEEQARKFLDTRPQTSIEKVFVFDEPQMRDKAIFSLEELKQEGRAFRKKHPRALGEAMKAIRSEDLATLVYTSGTTGPPKGAMITHGNVCSVCEALERVWPFEEGDAHLSYLPLAHVYERVGGQFFCLYAGGIIAYAGGLDTIVDDARDVKPTIFLGVPRVYEKMHQRIQAKFAEEKPLKRAVIDWALEVGQKAIPYRQRGEALPPLLRVQYNLADQLVYKKLREALGGRVKHLMSAAAPLAKEIQTFFQACGFLLLEGYGLTESTAPATINLPDAYKIGTVGRPLPGLQVKIAEDGEILLKGPSIFQGYYKQEEASREVLREGWLHTGDVGELDEDGFLRITDRKKDIIITAGGKNVAPQNIENLIKTDPLISQAVVIGDRKPYLVALITLNIEALEAYAKEKGYRYRGGAELLKSKEVEELVGSIIEKKNRQLARFETIKRFKILPEDFSIEGGELTPTMKVKRRVVQEKHRDLIDELYR